MEWWTHLWLNEGFATWKSLAAYIKKHACSNAKTEDPWAALEEDSGEPVNKLTNLWRKQKGYPVVSVKIKDEMLEFEQERSLSINLDGVSPWSKINVDQTCFYGVKYDEGLAAKLRDPNIVLEVLNFLLSLEVRSQDALCGLSVCREGRETAWTWLKFSSFERAKEVEEFFSTPTKAAMARTLKQSIERVHINTQWVQSVQNDKHLSEIVQELARRKN
ncbi:hypothetical protein CRG98_007530 [Punica granatum]|uniref:Peptidase M1 membrane alanine aminopeptidase domain-containing protein n=1 Tax=Punica granatum TaxID=22663 RepID=A0A2I0KUQ5_PUNGR|nr:hypothetical protein CRG98_007530 [Punica granatum]